MNKKKLLTDLLEKLNNHWTNFKLYQKALTFFKGDIILYIRTNTQTHTHTHTHTHRRCLHTIKHTSVEDTLQGTL